jgi:hypothetical protein
MTDHRSVWRPVGALLIARRQRMVLRVEPTPDGWRGTVKAGTWASATSTFPTLAEALEWTERTSDELATDPRKPRKGVPAKETAPVNCSGRRAA